MIAISKAKKKIHGVKREWSNPIFVYCKKHFCPYCGSRLEIIKSENIISSHSKDAKNYDFSNGDGFMIGNIKFIRTEFFCKKCNRTYSLKEAKQNDFLISKWQ